MRSVPGIRTGSGRPHRLQPGVPRAVPTDANPQWLALRWTSSWAGSGAVSARDQSRVGPRSALLRDVCSWWWFPLGRLGAILRQAQSVAAAGRWAGDNPAAAFGSGAAVLDKDRPFQWFTRTTSSSCSIPCAIAARLVPDPGGRFARSTGRPERDSIDSHERWSQSATAARTAPAHHLTDPQASGHPWRQARAYNAAGSRSVISPLLPRRRMG